MATMGMVKLPPDFDLQGQNAAGEWKFWKTAFEDYLVAIGQDKAAGLVKLSILRNIIGTESARIMSTFVIPEDQQDKYEYMLELITKYVNPRINECFERYNFLKRVQKEGETFEHFLTECRHLVKSCNYNTLDPNQTSEDKALRDKIVMGIRDPTTREALLRLDELTLDKTINFCRTSEQSRNQSIKFQEGEEEVNFIKKYKKPGEKKRQKSEQQDAKDKFKCKRCQNMHGPRECPAYGKKCRKCGLLNHFAISCRIKNVKNVEEKCDTSEENLFVGNISKDLPSNKSNSTSNSYRNPTNIWEEFIHVENKRCKVRLDTGADVSVIPSTLFNCINKKFKVRDTHCILKGFEGSQVKPIGIVNLYCKYKSVEMYEDFVIVEGANQVLLSGLACVKLQLVKRVNNISVTENGLNDREKFINKNFEIFSGYGKFPGKYNITTVENFEPVSYPPTKVPITLRNELKNEIDRLIKRNAIVKVDEINSNASINRMVIVEKTNGKLRLCLDPSDLNRQIVRKPKIACNIEEICANLNGKKIFTVFDLAEGYHHLELTEEASWKCCFATPFGIYRFTVLPYGLSNSQDLFQDVVEREFGNIKNVQICHDDMIVAGATREEHDQAVSEVVKKAKEVGAKFNKEKLQYCQSQVKFMGQMFSESGMQIDPDRIESLCKLEIPKNKNELQRIIGSFNYVRRYIKNMAEYMHLLCELLKNNIEWQWLPAHQKAFDTLKKIICNSPGLTPFDYKRKIILQCDASKNGLGCCMFQQYENNIVKLVSCASRMMNEHEVNYSQTEKELLAIYFATQKFHDFIYGRNFDVQSDHKPIVSIMKKPICKIGSVRLQRIRLKLLKYNINVYYVPGKSIHFADMLSRSSLKSTGKIDNEMFEMVHSVSKHIPMSNEKRDEFRIETCKDKTLMKLYDYYYNGWPKTSSIPPDCLPYVQSKNSIYIESGIIFLNDKVIVPTSLRVKMCELLHKGHIGTSKTIHKARLLFYWPNLSDDIINYIKKCRVCEKYRPANYREPLLPHTVPKLRFNKIGADILEFGCKSYLVVIDHFSHWIECILLKDKTAESVINAFQEIFIRFGYPTYIIADNLPFISSRLKKYYRAKDITIKTCSPHYHQSNGLAEKAVNICKQMIKKSLDENSDFRESVMEYNNSPIINLNASPAQILQSRILKSQLPLSDAKLQPRIQNNIYKQLCKQKDKVKIQYDKMVRRYPFEYKKGDKVVIRSNIDKIWYKATILEKANEPRSYWVRKEDNNRIVRRNTSQIKLSFTEPEKKVLTEPELFPELLSIPNMSSNPIMSLNPHVSVEQNENVNVDLRNKVIKSRSGRNIKPPRKLDL